MLCNLLSEFWLLDSKAGALADLASKFDTDAERFYKPSSACKRPELEALLALKLGFEILC